MVGNATSIQSLYSNVQKFWFVTPPRCLVRFWRFKRQNVWLDQDRTTRSLFLKKIQWVLLRCSWFSKMCLFLSGLWEIVDSEQMLCYCVGCFNKSTLVLWHQPQCLSSWADESGCCDLTVINVGIVMHDAVHQSDLKIVVLWDMFRDIVKVN